MRHATQVWSGSTRFRLMRENQKSKYFLCVRMFFEMFGFAWGEEWWSERRVIDGISGGMKAKRLKRLYKEKTQEDVVCVFVSLRIISNESFKLKAKIDYSTI